jgi:pimeloyl-ACP methyl ester carboxylesterase
MRTQFLAVAGGQIAYDDSQTGRALVVLVPGFGDTRRSYRFLRPRVAGAGYRVVTMDLRGHGETTVPWRDYTQTAVGLDVVDLLRHLDAGPAVLVGNSYAAGAVVWAAAQAPALIAGIVSIGGFLCRPRNTIAWRLLLLLATRSVTVWCACYGYAHRTVKPADFADYRASLAAKLREPGRREAMAAMAYSPAREGQRWAGMVDCPALVIMGAKDPAFPDPAAEATAQARLLNCPAHLIDGAGHYPQSEFPDHTAEILLPFLSQALGGPVPQGT